MSAAGIRESRRRRRDAFGMGLRNRDAVWVRADAFLAGLGKLEWSAPLTQLVSGRRGRRLENARTDFRLEGEPLTDQDGQALCRRYGLRADAGRVVRMIPAPQ